MDSDAYNRQFLKSGDWNEWAKTETDQRKGIPVPAPQEPYPQDAPLIDLVVPEHLSVGQMPLIEAIRKRRSHRRYTSKPLSLEELSFLLWATQGVRESVTQKGEFVRVYRTAPSGGARHPFETYLLVRRVEGLDPGLYRYLSLEHKLLLLDGSQELTGPVHEAARRQMVKDSAVVFIWTAVPYRTEWRYAKRSAKIIAQDSGHLCQNLYLACEAINAGTCAIGAYNQDQIDAILGVDGQEEFTIYLATVGKIA